MAVRRSRRSNSSPRLHCPSTKRRRQSRACKTDQPTPLAQVRHRRPQTPSANFHDELLTRLEPARVRSGQARRGDEWRKECCTPDSPAPTRLKTTIAVAQTIKAAVDLSAHAPTGSRQMQFHHGQVRYVLQVWRSSVLQTSSVVVTARRTHHVSATTPEWRVANGL